MFRGYKHHPDFSHFIRDPLASTSGRNESEKLFRTMQCYAFFIKLQVLILCMEFNSKDWPHMRFRPFNYFVHVTRSKGNTFRLAIPSASGQHIVLQIPLYSSERPQRVTKSPRQPQSDIPPLSVKPGIATATDVQPLPIIIELSATTPHPHKKGTLPTQGPLLTTVGQN